MQRDELCGTLSLSFVDDTLPKQLKKKIIEGHSVASVSHSQPIRYLGVHCCFDGSWQQQREKSYGLILLFTRAVTKFRVTINQAAFMFNAFMFNAFLLPKLELALRYVHGRGTSEWVKKCDALVMGCIKHAAQSPLKLSHSALALTLRINLPSWLETAVKVSELFLRLNSTGCRWGMLGRLLWRQALPLALDAAPAPALQRSFGGAGSRLKRAQTSPPTCLVGRYNFKKEGVLAVAARTSSTPSQLVRCQTAASAV